MLNSGVECAALILLVDDEPLIQALIEEALSEAGFVVETASSGEEAPARLEVEGRGYDALITDIGLGFGLNGWDVARRSRESDPHLPVVYISGASAADWRTQGVAQSVMIPKPAPLGQIVTAMATLVNQRSA